MKKFNKEDAFTGLEAAIVLIAFVVVAAVFSYVVLGAGFFTTQKSQEVVHSGVTQASSNIVVKGEVYGIYNETASADGISYIRFNLDGEHRGSVYCNVGSWIESIDNNSEHLIRFKEVVIIPNDLFSVNFVSPVCVHVHVQCFLVCGRKVVCNPGQVNGRCSRCWFEVERDVFYHTGFIRLEHNRS